MSARGRTIYAFRNKDTEACYTSAEVDINRNSNKRLIEDVPFATAACGECRTIACESCHKKLHNRGDLQK